MPNLPAAAAPVSALQSLVRVPLAELATAATRLAQQGALPQQTAKRVKDLVGRLAAKDSDSPRGVAARSGGPRLRSGRMFRFPPPEGLAASAAVPGRPAGLGLGLSQRGKQAKQAEVLCELPTPEALTAYLHASYLGEGEAAQAAAAPAVSARSARWAPSAATPWMRPAASSLAANQRLSTLARGGRWLLQPSSRGALRRPCRQQANVCTCSRSATLLWLSLSRITTRNMCLTRIACPVCKFQQSARSLGLPTPLQIESLLVRLPGVRRLLDSLPRHKRGLQVRPRR